jgi:hypothetical protein
MVSMATMPYATDTITRPALAFRGLQDAEHRDPVTRTAPAERTLC